MLRTPKCEKCGNTDLNRMELHTTYSPPPAGRWGMGARYLIGTKCMNCGHAWPFKENIHAGY